MKKLLRWPVLWWLRFWARLAFRRVNPFIIGVTGSAGKSSAVEAISLVAALKFKRVKVAKKANSESGIPADMLGLHFVDYSPLDWLRICLLAPLRFLTHFLTYPLSLIPYPFDCYIVEMGVDDPLPPKNMEYLLTILKPHIGVVLNALPVHTEQFERTIKRSVPSEVEGRTLIELIAAEKGKLITENPNLKFAILNADQPEIISLTPTNKARVVTFGKQKDADVVIKSVNPSLEGTSMTFRLQGSVPSTGSGSDLIRIRFPHLALPDFYGHSIAAAFAVASALHIDPNDARDAISQNFSLPAGRGQLFEGIKNITMIDSSYNASREPMIGSLRLLEKIAGERKKIAILGDMRELGSQAESEHTLVAEEVLKTVDHAILVGPLMRKFVLSILRKHHKPAEWFLTAGEAAKFLLDGSHPSGGKDANLQGGEIILVKGSQNTIFLEIVVEALLAHPEDVHKLCRRGSFWDQQRKPYRENIL